MIPGWSTAWITVAPAPSPNRMLVPRSVKFRNRLNTSAPISRTVSAMPEVTNAVAVDSPYEKPAHAACTSKAGQVTPSLRWVHTAVEGKGISPVVVATTIMSICSGLTPALSSASRPAASARSDVTVPSSANRRDSMPVRSRIHSSDVSIWVSNQVFGTARGGSADPTPVMVAFRVTRRGYRTPEAVARDRAARRHDEGVATSRPGACAASRGLRRSHRSRPASVPRRALAASGDPTAAARAPGTTRFASFVRTSPGPASRKTSAPAVRNACAHASHRTGDTTWRASSSRTSPGSFTSAPVTFDATGNRGAENAAASIASRSGATAGSINGEWNAPATRSRTARIFRSAHSASARSIAATLPLITTCCGEFSFATSSTSSPRASSHSAAASAAPTPSSALIVPGRSSPARCISRPRTATIRSASANDSTPAATSAANSPSECPAAPTHARTPRRLQHAERGDVDRQQRRLRELGGGEQRLVAAVGHEVAPQHAARPRRGPRGRRDARPTDRPCRRTASPAPGRRRRPPTHRTSP